MLFTAGRDSARRLLTGGFMRLRCVRGRSKSPFVEGRVYDVAEILEMPLHCMVRKPDGRWPRPGERWFGWHPDEWFANPEAGNGLEILSCGYRHVEEECYGVVIPRSRYKHVPRFESMLARAVDQLSGPIWRLCCHRVLTRCCFPDLERSFCIVGMDHDDLGRKTSYRKARRMVRGVLSALNLAELSSTIGDLSLDFWEKSWRFPGGLTWPDYVHPE